MSFASLEPCATPPCVQPSAQKILVIRYRFIGDTLLTVPFLRNLRAAYPHAQIDMLSAPQSIQLLQHCPYVDRLIPYATSKRHRYELNAGAGVAVEAPKSFWGMVRHIRREGYDMAFVLKRSVSSAAMAWLGGVPVRVGFDTANRGWMLTHKVPYRMDTHEADSFLSLLKVLGIAVDGHGLEAFWDEATDRRMAEAFAPYANKHNVVLHLTSSHPGKQWPLEHFVTVARELLQAEPSLTLHFLGAPQDVGVIEAFCGLWASAGADGKGAAGLEGSQDWAARCVNWAGKTSLLESLALLVRMARVIGVDSGTLHMAAAVGVPVTALFGPMSEKKWAPLPSLLQAQQGENPHRVVALDAAEMPCRPCHLKKPCPVNYACMQQLQPNRVIEGSGLTHKAL